MDEETKIALLIIYIIMIFQALLSLLLFCYISNIESGIKLHYDYKIEEINERLNIVDNTRQKLDIIVEKIQQLKIISEA
jgi:hypothetical protein